MNRIHKEEHRNTKWIRILNSIHTSQTQEMNIFYPTHRHNLTKHKESTKIRNAS